MLATLKAKFRAVLTSDAVRRAGHTAWQTFGGVVGAWWLASGVVGVHQVNDVDSAKRFALSAGAAVLAAAGSALKTGLLTLASKRSVASVLIEVAGTGPGTTEPDPDVAEPPAA